jgi:hypothetical protein
VLNLRGQLPIVLGGVLVSIAGVALVASYWHHDRTRLQRFAAPHLSCPAEEIRVRAESNGDTQESYLVEGCGRRGRVLCAMQDPDCGFLLE